MTGTDWEVERIVRVVDGDTVRLIRRRTSALTPLADGLGVTITVRDTGDDGASVRLVWLDTPERGQHGYKTARDDLELWTADALELGPLRVICYESAGWDRTLGDLIDANGNSASQWLMTERGWPAYRRGN